MSKSKEPKKPEIKKNYKNIDGKMYIKKTYFMSDQAQKECCFREILVRRYLELQGQTIATYMKEIEPDYIQETIEKYSEGDIRSNFENCLEELINQIDELKCVSLIIEQGENNVSEIINLKSVTSDKSEYKNIIVNMYSIVNTLKSMGVIHFDLKPDNFLFAKRNSDTVLVLNDFDSAYVMSTGNTGCQCADYITIRYAAPEALNDDSCGFAYDVWSVSMIAYRLLNEYEFPPEINEIIKCNFDNETLRNHLINAYEETDKLTSKRQDKLTDIILNGLIINPENRWTAKKIIDQITKLNDKKGNGKVTNTVNINGDNNSNVIQAKTITINNTTNVDKSEGVVIGVDNVQKESPKKAKNIAIAVSVSVLLLIIYLIGNGTIEKLFDNISADPNSTATASMTEDKPDNNYDNTSPNNNSADNVNINNINISVNSAEGNSNTDDNNTLDNIDIDNNDGINNNINNININ